MCCLDNAFTIINTSVKLDKFLFPVEFLAIRFLGLWTALKKLQICCHPVKIVFIVGKCNHIICSLHLTKIHKVKIVRLAVIGDKFTQFFRFLKVKALNRASFTMIKIITIKVWVPIRKYVQ